jgi:hypothetical protein
MDDGIWTLKQVKDGEGPSVKDGLWMTSAWGPLKVRAISERHDGPWAVVGEGFNQRSFCVHGGTRMFESRDDAQSACDLTEQSNNSRRWTA